MMMLKYKIAAAVPVRAIAAGAASAAVAREISVRTRTVPAKPMMVSAIPHAPALPSAHSPANGPVHIKTIGSAQQAAQLARRDRLVLEHLPLVKAIAIRVRGSVPVQVDQDDLVHAGILGLFDAANKFNPEEQVVFSSYAKYRIRGAILDSLRQLDSPIVKPRAERDGMRGGTWFRVACVFRDTGMARTERRVKFARRRHLDADNTS